MHMCAKDKEFALVHYSATWLKDKTSQWPVQYFFYICSFWVSTELSCRVTSCGKTWQSEPHTFVANINFNKSGCELETRCGINPFKWLVFVLLVIKRSLSANSSEYYICAEWVCRFTTNQNSVCVCHFPHSWGSYKCLNSCQQWLVCCLFTLSCTLLRSSF